MRADLEERKARQYEEGKIAMREYRENQQNTLRRMAELKAQRFAKEASESAESSEASENGEEGNDRREKKIDEALKETFPASDPPAFVAPRKRPKPKAN